MKKKSASRSAFFNLRVLIGLFVVLAGVFLALAGLGTFSAITASSAQAQQKQRKIINVPGLPPGFDCATIHEKGIDRMENLRAGAIMIACGEAEGGSASPGNVFAKLAQKLLPVPLAYGAADVDLVTGTETPPHIIQSETFTTANPDNPDEIVVAFNDSRGAAVHQFSGVSCSTDGGMTFTRVTNASGQGPFANTFGDPCCSVQQADPDVVHGLAGWATGAALSAGISRPLLRIQIAGPISAFTTTAATTANLAGPTITQALRSMGG